MEMKHASHDSTATPSKDSPSSRGRDTREGAHDDDTDEQPNNPPNHGKSTNPEAPATFLELIGEQDIDPPVAELGNLYRDWKRRQENGEQAELGEWSA